MTYLLARPEISGEIILENQVLVVGVTEEIAFCYWLVLVVEEFERVLVRELYHWVLERADLLKHLIRNLRVQTHGAMLKLVERGIESLVNADELFLKSFEFALILNLRLFQSSDLVGQLIQISLAPLDVLLALHQEDLLLFVMLFHGFGEGVFSVFEHLDHEFEFLVQLAQRIVLLLLQLLLDFFDIVLEYLSFL